LATVTIYYEYELNVTRSESFYQHAPSLGPYNVTVHDSYVAPLRNCFNVDPNGVVAWRQRQLPLSLS